LFLNFKVNHTIEATQAAGKFKTATPETHDQRLRACMVELLNFVVQRSISCVVKKATLLSNVAPQGFIARMYHDLHVVPNVGSINNKTNKQLGLILEFRAWRT